MKVRPYCKDCLKDLARQVVNLSGGDEELLASSFRLVEGSFGPDMAPTDISNRLHRHVRRETGVEDPYADRKKAEFREALNAAGKLKGFFPDTLEGALQIVGLRQRRRLLRRAPLRHGSVRIPRKRG